MTLLVRDEADIIQKNIDFHLCQGVDYFIVMDNRSVDATKKILKKYEDAGVLCYLYQGDDDYDQHKWVTEMARMAAIDFKADWVINNDADEFWWPSKNRNIKEALASVPKAVNIIQAERSDFVFLGFLNKEEYFFNQMIFKKRISLNSLGRPLPPKQAHRSNPEVIISQGNHFVSGFENPNVIEGIMDIFHFPVRTSEQFTNKIIKGGGAYANNKNLDNSVGATWRELFKDFQKNGDLKSFLSDNKFDFEEIVVSLVSGELVIDRRLRDYLSNCYPRV